MKPSAQHPVTPVKPHLTVLLIGPTGAGKTPLGEFWAAQGWQGRRCHHFDFGENLRRVAAERRGFTADELRVVDDALAGAALLENENFCIAARILARFMTEQGVTDQDILIMNGLPRHVDQATDVDRLLSIEAVLVLECDARVVHARIARDTGGDRAIRVDDDVALIEKKLAIFRERTTHLLDHYRAKGVRVQALAIGVQTTPEEAASLVTA
jgi:adenylate kinase